MIIELTKELFEEKISDFGKEFKFKGDKPVMIDFFAPWCNPCKTIAPIVEELAIEYKDKIDIYKLNTEDEPGLASLFGIQSIPSMLFIPIDKEPQMSIGAISKESFKTAFKDILGVE